MRLSSFSKLAFQIIALCGFALPTLSPDTAVAARSNGTQNAKKRAKKAVKKNRNSSQQTSKKSSQQKSAPKAKRKPQPYEQGYMTFSLAGGTVNNFGNTQLVIGGNLGYFLLDGLEFSAGLQGYFFNDPTTFTLTPGLRYVVHQIKKVTPYLGAFYKYNFIGDVKVNGQNYDLPNSSSFGGRGGILYNTGSGTIGAGLAIESIMDCDKAVYDECYLWYPEVSFAIGF